MRGRFNARLSGAGGILAPLLVAAAYVAAAKFGFTFAFATKQVTAVWPPTGIALAALLLWGFRVWPGIWVGAFISNALSGEPIWTAAAIAIGNTLAPLFGAFLLRRFGAFHCALERVRDVLLLLLFGSAIAVTVSATNGVIDLSLARIIPWNAAQSVWWVWWTGDAMGVLFVAPLLLTWIAGRKQERAEGGSLELALLGVTMVAVTCASFLGSNPLRLSVYPFIIWSALRFRQRETTAAIAIVAGIAVWATTHGAGPWTTGSLDLRLVQLDSWMAIFAITGLVLGAVSAEKRAARAALDTVLAQTKHSVETLQTAFLPAQLPRRAGLRCDALYIAAEREALIGGDWYDAFELPDGRIVLSIGDVTGHGLDAAVSAAQLRRNILVAAFETGEPAGILARTADALQSELDVSATALVAIVSQDLTTLSYASAGHPPPILASPTIPARLLDYGGVPIGTGIPIAAQTRTIALEPGAVLLLYTDGLVEFARDILRAEAIALNAVSRLVSNSHIEHPAAFVQRCVMGSRQPTDDTVLLVAQFGTAEA